MILFGCRCTMDFGFNITSGITALSIHRWRLPSTVSLRDVGPDSPGKETKRKRNKKKTTTTPKPLPIIVQQTTINFKKTLMTFNLRYNLTMITVTKATNSKLTNLT